jgi:hypothetical protein
MPRRPDWRKKPRRASKRAASALYGENLIMGHDEWAAVCRNRALRTPGLNELAILRHLSNSREMLPAPHSILAGCSTRFM